MHPSMDFAKFSKICLNATLDGTSKENTIKLISISIC